MIVTAAVCGSSRDPDTVSSSVNGVTNAGLEPIRLPWPPGTACCTPSGPRIWPLVRSEYRGTKVSALFVVPCTSKSMNPWFTSVAPGPNPVRVNALLFQKMSLNWATGREKSGRVAAFGYCATYRASFCHSGSLPSDASPAECGSPIAEFSDEAVATLFATVLLMIRTLDESSSIIAPPMSADPLSTIWLSRMLITPLSASSTNTPPPSSPE